jgi:hypothetical protein
MCSVAILVAKGDWLVAASLNFLTNRRLSAESDKCDPGVAGARFTCTRQGQGAYAADVPPWYADRGCRGYFLTPPLSAARVLAWLARSQRFGPLLLPAIAHRRALLEHVQAAGRFAISRGRGPALYEAARRAFFERLRRRDPRAARRETAAGTRRAIPNFSTIFSTHKTGRSESSGLAIFHHDKNPDVIEIKIMSPDSPASAAPVSPITGTALVRCIHATTYKLRTRLARVRCSISADRADADGRIMPARRRAGAGQNLARALLATALQGTIRAGAIHAGFDAADVQLTTRLRSKPRFQMRRGRCSPTFARG